MADTFTPQWLVIPYNPPQPPQPRPYWIPLSFILSFAVLFLLRAQEITVKNTNTPLMMTRPTHLVSTGQYSLAPLNACGQPERIGIFDAHSVACQPRESLTLDQFALRLVPLNLINESESLAAPPTAASRQCPLVVLYDNRAVGARLCFTEDGGVYRAIGTNEISDWAWYLDQTGQWQLSRAPVIAKEMR